MVLKLNFYIIYEDLNRFEFYKTKRVEFYVGNYNLNSAWVFTRFLDIKDNVKVWY